MPAPKPKVPATCRYCGKVRYVNSSVADRPFCNRECFRAWIRLPEQRKSSGERLAKHIVYSSGSNNHNWKPNVTVQCDHCGASLEKKPGRINRHNFCDHDCHDAWQGGYPSDSERGIAGKPNTQCAECGKPLRRQPSELKKSKHFFCSPKCHGEWDSKHKVGPNGANWRGGPVTVQCSWCGKKMEKPLAWAKKHESHFCSTECSANWRFEYFSGPNNPCWKGGKVPYYGSNWNRQRRKARKRDNHTCQRCGVTSDELGQRLDVHHIVPFRHFLTLYGDDPETAAKKANKLSNLICYCRVCHATVERAS